VVGVIAQRLVRKICPACRKERFLTDEEREHLHLDRERLYTVSQGDGCAECRGTGYRGRSGLFEVMDMSGEIRTQLSGTIDASRLADVARANGMITLREVAIQKMLEGITTYEEVVAVTG
jgi:general secretion pathway protein E